MYSWTYTDCAEAHLLNYEHTGLKTCLKQPSTIWWFIQASNLDGIGSWHPPCSKMPPLLHPDTYASHASLEKSKV